MRRIIINLLFLAISTIISVAAAQDVIYLKDGSVIKGSIIEIFPEQTVKIQTSDGLIYVYQMSDVDRITNDDRQTERNEIEPQGDSGDYLKRGFRGIIDFGVCLGIDKFEDYALLTSSFTFGYQLNRLLFVGGGIAPTMAFYDYYDFYIYDNYWTDKKEDRCFVLPIYGALRIDFVNTKVSPFLDTRLGYSVTDDCKGLCAHVGVGCRIFRCSLSLGYTYQKLDHRNWFTDHYDFTGFRAGFEF